MAESIFGKVFIGARTPFSSMSHDSNMLFNLLEYLAALMVIWNSSFDDEYNLILAICAHTHKKWKNGKMMRKNGKFEEEKKWKRSWRTLWRSLTFENKSIFHFKPTNRKETWTQKAILLMNGDTKKMRQRSSKSEHFLNAERSTHTIYEYMPTLC